MIKLEFRNVDFCGGKKTEEPRERINNKLNSHMMQSPEIELGHSDEKRTLSATSPMLPIW
jgi:hypothetical protein